MSDNKFNYFAVVTTTLVKAKNKQDAEKISMGRRNVNGEVLFKSTDIERISSVQAHKQINQLSA
jgi:hypothetical protein